MARYRVAYTREGPHWVAQVEDPDISTYGRNLGAAKLHVREAIATYLETDRVDENDLDEDVRLGKDLQGPIEDLVAKRRRVDELEAEVGDKTREFAMRLVEGGYSTRDAGEILGISHQRVAQVVDAGGRQDQPTHDRRQRPENV